MATLISRVKLELLPGKGQISKIGATVRITCLVLFLITFWAIRFVSLVPQCHFYCGGVRPGSDESLVALAPVRGGRRAPEGEDDGRQNGALKNQILFIKTQPNQFLG